MNITTKKKRELVEATEKIIKKTEARIRYCNSYANPACTCIDRFPFVVCEESDEQFALVKINDENAARFSSIGIPLEFSREGAAYAVKFYAEKGIKAKILRKREWSERRLEVEKKKLEEYKLILEREKNLVAR